MAQITQSEGMRSPGWVATVGLVLLVSSSARGRGAEAALPASGAAPTPSLLAELTVLETLHAEALADTRRLMYAVLGARVVSVVGGALMISDAEDQAYRVAGGCAVVFGAIDAVIALGPPWRDWPKRLENDVWAVGHPSTKNFGALAYYIAREQGGILIDPPKPSEALYQWLAEHGGVRWLFLTHRDHTHHHAEFARRFPGCRRILGSADVNRRESEYRPATGDVEFKLGDSLAPPSLTGEPLPEAALSQREFVALPQPGHTPGSLCLLYRGRFLFSGDHLGYARHLGHPVAPRLQCWEDWERQSRSVRYLATLAAAGHLRFSWLLPGHGEWHRLPGSRREVTGRSAFRTARDTAATMGLDHRWNPDRRRGRPDTPSARQRREAASCARRQAPCCRARRPIAGKTSAVGGHKDMSHVRAGNLSLTSVADTILVVHCR